jgi:hypothetical protein
MRDKPVTIVFFDQDVLGAHKLYTYEDLEVLVARINKDTRKPMIYVTDTEGNKFAVKRQLITSVAVLSNPSVGRGIGDLRADPHSISRPLPTNGLETAT